MKFVDVLGFVAGACTTIAFLPQVIQTWKTKSAKDLSLGMFIIFSTGTLLWLCYGLMIGALPVILANAVTLVLASLLLYFKLVFKE